MKSPDVITPKENEKFTQVWWNLFIAQTQGLKKTTVFEDCLNSDETLLMRNYLMDIITQLSQMRTSQFGYRVFLDGQQLGQKAMETIYDKPPLPEESFEDWAARSFKDVKFGMIINRGEKFSPDLPRENRYSPFGYNFYNFHRQLWLDAHRHPHRCSRRKSTTLPSWEREKNDVYLEQGKVRGKNHPARKD